MDNTFLELTHKYYGDYYYGLNYFRLKNFIKDNKINNDEQYKLSQYGGNKYSTIINDIEFTIDYFINDNEDHKIIFIYDKNNTNISNRNCAQLYFSNNDELKIVVLNTPRKCLKFKNELVDDKLKYGEIMIKLIINYAKQNNFKIITLDDDSKFYCIDSLYELSYELRHVNILTTGYPWYYKFGFKYINKDDHNKVKSNKKKLDKLLTKDLPFEILLSLILETINDNNLYNLLGDNRKSANKTLIKISKLYMQKKDSQIYDFFYIFSRSYCDIISKIYRELFEILNLELIPKIEDLKMILDLNKIK
jgi:hypothetical protein